MESSKIHELLKEKFGEAITDVADSGDGWVTVNRDNLVELAEFIQTNEDLSFDLLHCITGVDRQKGNLQSIYNFTSSTKLHWLTVKVDVTVEDPNIPTVSHLYKTANWHERESYDLLGIVYTDHPNLTRILCHEDWVGHPLRKDYEFPTEFKGVRCDVIQEEEEDIPLPRTIGPDGLPKKK